MIFDESCFCSGHDDCSVIPRRAPIILICKYKVECLSRGIGLIKISRALELPRTRRESCPSQTSYPYLGASPPDRNSRMSQVSLRYRIVESSRPAICAFSKIVPNLKLRLLFFFQAIDTRISMQYSKQSLVSYTIDQLYSSRAMLDSRR